MSGKIATIGDIKSFGIITTLIDTYCPVKELILCFGTVGINESINTYSSNQLVQKDDLYQDNSFGLCVGYSTSMYTGYNNKNPISFITKNFATSEEQIKNFGGSGKIQDSDITDINGNKIAPFKAGNQIQVAKTYCLCTRGGLNPYGCSYIVVSSQDTPNSFKVYGNKSGGKLFEQLELIATITSPNTNFPRINFPKIVWAAGSYVYILANISVSGTVTWPNQSYIIKCGMNGSITYTNITQTITLKNGSTVCPWDTGSLSFISNPNKNGILLINTAHADFNNKYYYRFIDLLNQKATNWQEGIRSQTNKSPMSLVLSDWADTGGTGTWFVVDQATGIRENDSKTFKYTNPTIDNNINVPAYDISATVNTLIGHHMDHKIIFDSKNNRYIILVEWTDDLDTFYYIYTVNTAMNTLYQSRNITDEITKTLENANYIDIRNAQITRDCSYLIIDGLIYKSGSSDSTRGYFFIILDIENNFVAKYYKFWDDIQYGMQFVNTIKFAFIMPHQLGPAND